MFINDNYASKAFTSIFFNATKLSLCLDSLLVPKFRECCSLFHQSEKQLNIELLL